MKFGFKSLKTKSPYVYDAGFPFLPEPRPLGDLEPFHPALAVLVPFTALRPFAMLEVPLAAMVCNGTC